MTPTVSRMVAAKRQELAYPLRWFSIPNLWRYERPQRGRLREHWQLNVDIFGEEGVAADHEIILVANSILKAFGAKASMYEIRVNSRALTDLYMKEYIGLNDDKAHELSKLIDRMDKLDEAKFTEALDELCLDMLDDVPAKIRDMLKVNTLEDLPDELAGSESSNQLKELLKLLEDSLVVNAKFDFRLMRGFDYYTDIVFEVFDTDPENNRSMFGGGRYDGLVGLFGVDSLPTVGFGMGDVTLFNFLVTHGLLPTLHSETDLLIVTIGDVYSGASRLAAKFRDMGLNIGIDATDRKLDKKLKSADKQGVRHVLFVGENELNEEQYPLKDLATGGEEKHSAERIVSIVKDYRTH
jgi:histidyl-tRNA synthetase